MRRAAPYILRSSENALNRDWLLTILILLGLVAGVVVGQMLYDGNYNANDPASVHAHAGALGIFEFIGASVFMGLLKMLIIPLVASSVIVGVTSVGDFSRLGRIGIATLFYYFSTMLIAVIIGLVIVTTIRPGDDLAKTANVAQMMQEQQTDSLREITDRGEVMADAGLMAAVRNLVGQMIPDNIVEAMAKGQPLGVICFSIFFAVIVTTLGDKGRIIVDFFSAVFEVLMRMVVAVMWLAPIGVFALLAWTIARIGLSVFIGPAGKFIVGSLIGIGIHGLIVLPLILWIFGRTNPFRFMFQIRQALLTALATDSSSATLPVTIECTTEYGGVGKETAGFVLPLGSTINMDGTALYEAVAAVFLAQAFGVDLSMTQLIIVAVTATLAAVGAAGIPSAGLVTLVIVIDSVNGSLGTPAIPVAGIGLILGFDRIVDMFRTVANVWGDAVGAKIIDRLAHD